jgi:hypothetical protein
MKTRFANFRRSRRPPGGSVLVVVLLVLLSVMLLLIAVNTATLNRLTREVKAIEKRQIQRLDPSAKPPPRPAQGATNFPAAK